MFVSFSASAAAASSADEPEAAEEPVRVVLGLCERECGLSPLNCDCDCCRCCCPVSAARSDPKRGRERNRQTPPSPQLSLRLPPPGFWLTGPPVPKERGAQPHEVCWARLLSYPWWPAVVRSPPPASALALRRKPESVFVVFFGDGNCAWLSPRSLDRFASGYGKRSAKPRRDLQKAVDEAWRALGVARPVAAGGAAAGGGSGGEELALPEGFDESRPALAPIS